MIADIQGLKLVESADVVKAGRLAGALRRVDNSTTFTYEPGYLSDRDAPPVAVSLPKVHFPAVGSAGAVPPFFAGMLPEGLRLDAVVLQAKTSIDDHLTLLMAVGDDLIGDVQVLAHDQRLPDADAHPRAAEDVSPDDTSVPDLREIFAAAVGLHSLSQLGTVGLPGVQVKVSALMSTPVPTRRGPAILKLAPDRHPQMINNEHFFLGLASHCGISTVEHRLVRDDLGQTGLLVRRFDRLLGESGLTRLAQEDACQVLNRFPSAKYQLSAQEVIGGLGAAVRELGGSAALTMSRALSIYAYSWVIGNGDLHAKNLSIHDPGNGIWGLTPAYDLLCTQPYLGWQDPMALRLLGRDDRFTRASFLEAAEHLGVNRSTMVASLDRIVTGVKARLGQVSQIGFDTATTVRLTELLEARSSALSA